MIIIDGKASSCEHCGNSLQRDSANQPEPHSRSHRSKRKQIQDTDEEDLEENMASKQKKRRQMATDQTTGKAIFKYQ